MQKITQKDIEIMNRIVALLLFIILLIGCGTTNKKTTPIEDKIKLLVTIDTIPKVTGIGGVFFFSDNPKEAREWYAKNLGFDINAWGSTSFDTRDVKKSDQINSVQWRAFKTGNTYFAPSKKDFMINYKVQNIEGLVAKLKENGVTVLDTMAAYDYGKFIHIMDAEGNKIELWEPIEADKTSDKKNK
jgi:predicted enzyme related to lactoylglutathione lyase